MYSNSENCEVVEVFILSWYIWWCFFFFEEFLRSQLSYVVFYKNCNHLFERKMILIWLHPRESGVQEMQDVFWWKTWKCKLRLCRKSSKNQTFNCASELRHININFFIFFIKKILDSVILCICI